MEHKENAKCSCEEGTCTESCSCGSTCSHWAIPVVLLVIFLLAHAIAFPFAASYVAQKTADRVLANEYAKVGGKEVYDLLNEAQALQIKAQLPEIKAFLESKKTASGATTTPTAQANPETPAGLTLSSDEIASILKDSYVEGKASARFLLVEYSDLECPYCIRQYKDGVIKGVEDKYGEDVRHVFKPFRAVPHPGAEPKAIASLCVAQLGGVDKYAKFYSSIFDASDMQGKVYPVSDLAKLAKQVGVDQKKFSACYDAKKTVGLYDAYTAEWQKYGVQGTPGTLIVDTQSGKATLMAGAFAIDKFVAAIDAMK